MRLRGFKISKIKRKVFNIKQVLHICIAGPNLILSNKPKLAIGVFVAWYPHLCFLFMHTMFV